MNPTTERSEVQYFSFANNENSYLIPIFKTGILDRLVKKYASFLLPTLVVDTSENHLLNNMSVEELNEAINSGNGLFLEISEEDAVALGLKESEGVELDPVTQKRIEKQLVDSKFLNLEVNKDSTDK